MEDVMTISRAVLIAVVAICCTTSKLTARMMVLLSYQQLLDKSDLVIIATPTTRTSDTAERSYLPNIFTQERNGTKTPIPSIGVETTFRIAVVLKGKPLVGDVVLHHYREASRRLAMDGPFLVAFDPSDRSWRRSYILFLVREPDGRYAPTGGQTDPGFQAVFSVPYLHEQRY
jgi:hypothetical protein